MLYYYVFEHHCDAPCAAPVMGMRSSACMSTHCVLLLLAGSTVQAACPSRTWCVLEVMAGLSGDWNSHPHTVSSV